MIAKKSRKEAILDAALACFTEHGVEATTIDMIRERSGASVGSLYHHFGSKENIAASVYAEALHEYHVYQQSLLTGAGDAETAVKAVAYAYVDWVAANPDKARFVLYNRGVVSKSDLADEIKARGRVHLSETMRRFKPFLEDGSLKNLPLEVFASLVTGPAHDYARLWLSGRTRTGVKAYREIFAEAAWSAVRP